MNNRILLGISHYFKANILRASRLPQIISQGSSLMYESLRRNFLTPMQQMFASNIDTRTFCDVVKAQGYDFENFEVETEDGYII